MTWKNTTRNVLMGSSYEEQPVVAATEVVSPLVPVPLNAPEPAMATEEKTITALRRAEFLSDSPVFTSNDPAVLAARFRDCFAPPAKIAHAETRARLQSEADAPVVPRPAPLVTSLEIDRAEKLAQRRSYQGFTPVMRKVVA